MAGQANEVIANTNSRLYTISQIFRIYTHSIIKILTRAADNLLWLAKII
jgi:hypothetical protein